VRHDPSVPQFYAQREVIGLERKSDGLGRIGTSKGSMPHTQMQKRRRIAAKSDLLSGSSPSPPDDPHSLVSATLMDSNSLNLPPPKRRRLSADKALVVSVVGIENVDVESISLGRRKRQM